MTYIAVPNHIAGPSVICGGVYVCPGPSVESAERIAAALNAAETADLDWTVPEFATLKQSEAQRVIRALAKRMRHAEGARP